MTKKTLKMQKGLVKKLRLIRDKINVDIQHMTLQEEKEYLNQLASEWKNAPRDDKFVDELIGRLDDEKVLSEIPRSQRRKKPLTLSGYQQKSATRNDAIIAAYASGGYTQKAIGDYFGLHYARISRIISMAKDNI